MANSVQVGGIKILHKRYAYDITQPGSGWLDTANHYLSFGEFGIDTVSGQVRGYTKKLANDSEICTWEQATIIGSVDLSQDAQIEENSSGKYIYGLETTTDEFGNTKYVLKTAQLPQLSVNHEKTEENAKRTFISSIDVSGHEIKWIDATIPEDYTVDYTKVPTALANKPKLISELKVEQDTTSRSYDTTLTYNEIKAQENSTLSVSLDGNNIVISIDDSNYARASDLTAAMQFVGVIDISKVSDLDTFTNNKNGYTYKVIQSEETVNNLSASIPFHYIIDGADKESEPNVDDKHIVDGVESGDMLVYVDRSNSDGSTTKHWCIIPSGNEEEGTVTAITVGDGLSTDVGEDKVIITEGLIRHRNTSEAPTTYTELGETHTANSQYYNIISKIDLDQVSQENGATLGHVVEAESNKVEILNRNTIDGLIKTEAPIIEETNAGVTVSMTEEKPEGDYGKDVNGNDIGQITRKKFTVKHNELTVTTPATTTSTHSPNGKFGFVKELTFDKYGHVTGYQLGEATDYDSHRPVSVNGTNVGLGYGAALNLKNGTNISITKDIDNNVVISTKGISSTIDIGFVKATKSTTDNDTVEVLDLDNENLAANDVTNYGLRVNSTSGIATVQVYDHKVSNLQDTESSDIVSGEAINSHNTSGYDYIFAAIQRDKYGHVINTAIVDTIDGNI